MSAFFSSVLQTIQHSNPHRVASWVLTISFVFSCLFCMFKDAYQEAATTLFSQLEPPMKQLDASYLFVYEVCLPVCSFFLVGIVVCLTIYAVMEEMKLFTKVSSEKLRNLHTVLDVNIARLASTGKFLLAFTLFEGSLIHRANSILTQPSSIKETFLFPIYWLFIIFALYDVVVVYPIGDTRRIQAAVDAGRSNNKHSCSPEQR